MRMENISDVRDLKNALLRLHGFPMCMQEVLHNSKSLDNSTKLDAPIDLQLVILALSTEVLQVEAGKELVAA